MRATGSHHPATLVNHWALMALSWCVVGYIIENEIQFDILRKYLLQRVGRFKVIRGSNVVEMS